MTCFWTNSFKKQFATYLADDIGSEDLEEMYTEAHAKIREDPAPQKADRSKLEEWKAESKKYRSKKLTLQERRQRVADKIVSFRLFRRLTVLC